MSELTDGKSFSEPIQFCTRTGSAGKPVIESPKWIDRHQTCYITIWIASILEETLWAHYNFCNQINIASTVRKNDFNLLFELRSENL
jgi:hypothetical protein